MVAAGGRQHPFVDLTHVNDDVALFEHGGVPGSHHLGPAELLGVEQHPGAQRFVAVKGPIVSPDFHGCFALEAACSSAWHAMSSKGRTGVGSLAMEQQHCCLKVCAGYYQEPKP